MNHQTHDAYNYSHIIPETINIIKNKDSCVNKKIIVIQGLKHHHQEK